MAPVIDIHAHYVSRDLIRESARNGARYGVALERDAEGRERLRFDGGALLRPFFDDLCDLERRVPHLDASGVTMQVVSTWTDLAGDALPPAEGARWARLQNETLAAGAKRVGGRFAAMGTLPLQSVAHSLEELDYAVKHLGIGSVEIGTHINGRELDHEHFRPVWKRIAELGVFVLLHPPFAPVGLDRVGDYFLNNLISYPVDTTIAASRLIFSGVMRDFPDLKICLAHGGGFLPYQIGRLDRGYAAHPACSRVLDRAPSEFLQSFYFDTLTQDTRALAFLVEMVGPERLLYGSDQPFEMLDPMGPARIDALDGLGAGDRAAILATNASRALGLAVPRQASLPTPAAAYAS
jgi:aminocarboxymuconate-semialdehyde decarboxylase